MSNEGKKQLDNLNNLVHFDDLLNRIKQAEVLSEKDYLRLVNLKEDKGEIAELKKEIPIVAICLIVFGLLTGYSLEFAEAQRNVSIALSIFLLIVHVVSVAAFTCCTFGLIFDILLLIRKKDEQKEWESEQENIKLAQKQYKDICGIVKDYINDPQQLFIKAVLLKEINPSEEKEKCLYRYWKDRLEGLKSDILSQVTVKTKEEVLKTNEQMGVVF